MLNHGVVYLKLKKIIIIIGKFGGHSVASFSCSPSILAVLQWKPKKENVKHCGSSRNP